MTPNSQPTSDQDIASARQALADNDLKHAAHHIAWALQADPENVAALAILDQIVAASPDPKTVVPLQSSMSSAEVAVHAYMSAERGDYDTAFNLIGQVNTALPDGRFLPWAGEWLGRSEAHKTASGEVIRLIAGIAQLYKGENITDAQLRPRLDRLVDGLALYVNAQPENGSEPGLNLVYALILRRVGRFEESLVRAKRAHDADPNPFALVAIAYAQRGLKQIEAALETFQQAVTLDPTYVEVYNDIGDLLISLGRIEEGATAYGKMLDVQPDNPWAAPHYYFFQYKLDGDVYWKRKLNAFVASHPDNTHAAELARSLSPDGVPFVDYLPRATEAIVNVARQVAEKYSNRDITGPTGPLKVQGSALESPSAVLAVTRFFAPKAQIVVNAPIQRPDPRKPLRNSSYVLWKYDGINASPALPEPSAQIAQAVGKIAETPFNITSWSKAARDLGKSLGEGKIEDVLRVMVHPPAAPEGVIAWDWIQGVQVAAALTIAYTSSDWERPIPKKGLFGKTSEPAPRHAALYGLLFGIGDWTTTAAIVALTQIALEEPERENQIANWFRDLYLNMPKNSYVPYDNALGTCGLRLPAVQKMAVRPAFEKLVEED